MIYVQSDIFRFILGYQTWEFAAFGAAAAYTTSLQRLQRTKGRCRASAAFSRQLAQFYKSLAVVGKICPALYQTQF